MFEPVTIKDIAKALGLSTSTVSRALRDTHEISAATKKIVLEYAKEINYQPNPIALSLKERRSKSIGVVVSEVANSYFSQAINGIESIAYDRGYHVILTQTHESYDREVINVQHLASRSVDGLLVSLSSQTNDISHLSYLHEKGLPIVFFDRVADEIETHKVIANNEKGAFEATNHLIKSGYKRIAHLTSSTQLSISIERLKGYEGALKANNIEVNPAYIKHCPHGGMIYEETENAIKELMALDEKPDAIFVAGDRLSTGCLSVFKNLKISVPNDMAIAGFSNSDVLDLFNPSLTSVRQPAFEIGQLATQMLLQLIEAKYPVEEFEKKILDTNLFVRNS
ncbi:substrate-binding domain-containing protein [Pedobacter sp. LMG 31464]|uniref:Substrate-binding domain-containing protein n=1 Tax=Pedobacter planticolens TaxID=2679964 RepID=A0A923IVW2_9SPHI|nr:LacI family DNA-binding transcriptional regulator [Pedobacter planticolens]MBB2144507.1 substrate-binding domain-containing protein [Pedobacter planticolens]